MESLRDFGQKLCDTYDQNRELTKALNQSLRIENIQRRVLALMASHISRLEARLGNESLSEIAFNVNSSLSMSVNDIVEEFIDFDRTQSLF